MSLHLSHPALLIPIPLLAALAFFLLRKTARHSRRWRLICLLFPALAASLIFAALADPILTSSPPAKNIVVFLDLSASTRFAPWRSPVWLRAFLKEHAAPNTQFTLLSFARSPQLLADNLSLDDPAWPATFPAPLDDTATNIPTQWRASPDDTRPRWLFTDGLADLSSLATLNTDLAITLAPPAELDVGVVDLRVLPRGDNSGAEIQTDIRATAFANAKVSLRRDNTLIASRLIAFPVAGTQSVSFLDDQPLASLPARYEIAVDPLNKTGGIDTDPWPENNHAAILAPPHGPAATLLVTSQPAPTTTPATAPSSSITRISPDQFPATLSALTAYQIIILDDLPASSLRPDSLAALDRFVRDNAGGLLILGRQHAFGPGHYPASPLEDLSPLASAPPQRPPQHILFILDTSGSMGETVGTEKKFNYVATGVANALATLRDTDRITALTFGNSISTLADGTKKEVAEKLIASLRLFPTGGPTDPDALLPRLDAAITDHAKLIFLTDGEIPKMDIARWTSLLKSASASLTIVAPPNTPQAPSPTLAALAKSAGATWLATDDPTEWPRLLVEAVEPPTIGHIRTDTFKWILSPQSPPATAGAPPSAPSETSLWIETWLAPGATARATPLAPPNSPTPGQPLAAIIRRGLGQVAAISFTDSSPAFTNLLASLTRDLTPPPGDRRFSATAALVNGHWRITLRGHDASTFLNNFKISATLISPDSPQPLTIPLTQTAPGEYAATLDNPPPTFSLLITGTPPAPPATAAAPTSAPTLIARLSPPSLAPPEYPASTTPGEFPSIPITHIDPTSTSQPWQPHLHGTTLPLAPLLYTLAALLLLTTLWLRRSGSSAT